MPPRRTPSSAPPSTSGGAPRGTLRRSAALAALTAAALGAGPLALPEPAVAAGPRIHDIQGTTRISPLAGQRVSDVPGTVTAVRAFGSARGFWLQDTRPDRDPATSEAIFVFTGQQTPSVTAGDSLRVDGTVDEYYPGGRQAGLQSVTQLSDATWTTLSSGGAPPTAFPLNSSTIPSRYAPGAGGGDIEALPLRPRSYALDRYESLEGMQVAVTDAPVVGPTSEHDELWVTAEPGHHRTARGGILYDSYQDPNPGRVKVASLIPFAERPFPVADVGDTLKGTTAGPLDYDNFGGYEIQATALGRLVESGPARETTRRQSPSELAVATYNVENLSPRTPRAKFERLAGALARDLASPDIVALEEVQDDNGPTDDSTVSAGVTLRLLTGAIEAAGGPAYDWRQIDPVDDQDGGQPGGNIRVAFLYNPERIAFADIPGGDATTAVRAVADNGRAALSASPGRIAPADPAWRNSRKPLAAQFSFKGRPNSRVFVVANHFNSKGGDQAVDGRFQPPARTSETQRLAQAAAVNSFTKDLLAIDPRADIVVAGDLNDYQFSPTLKALTSGGVLTDLVGRLPGPERYGYVFNGNSQILDHMLTSSHLARPSRPSRLDYDIVHINSEYADQASDHDPQVLRLKP